MKQCCIVLIMTSLTGFASQVFYTDLLDDIMLSDNIFMARVEQAFSTPMDYMGRMDYTLSVLEVIACSDTLRDSVVGVYTMYLPRFRILPSGVEEWESPIVNGSGWEFLFQDGDTVLVFGSALPAGDKSVSMNIVRLELPDSLNTVMNLLSQ